MRETKLRPTLSPAAWQQRLREREQAAFERGVVTGERAMSEQLLRLRTEVSELQKGILESLRRTVPQVIQETETALVALSLEAVRKLVAGIPVNTEMVEATVREALGRAQEATEFFIQVHPEDLALLQQTGSPLLAPPQGGTTLHVDASTAVSRGGCLVRTRFGIIDTRRETKLKQIEQTLQL